MAMFCPTCGGTLEADASFCSGCGSPVTASAPPEPTSPQHHSPGMGAPPPPPPAAPGRSTAAPSPHPPAAPVGYQPAMPGGYGAPPAAPAAGNQFAEFSGTMNAGAPAAGTRGPGRLLSVIIMVAIVAAVGVGVFLINRAMQVDLAVMSGAWSTVLVTETGERQTGTMTLTLDHRGEGTATFTGHAEITQPLEAVYKNGRLTLTGTDISLSGKVEEVRGVTDVQGKLNIAGRKAEWAALLQSSTQPAAAANTDTAPAAQRRDGAKTDAAIGDLVGDWEGTIRFTRIEGFETVPEEERPEDYQEIVDGMLNIDQPCTLSINEEGEWWLDVNTMGGLSLDSRVAIDEDSYESYTPPEMQIRPQNGSFSASYYEKTDDGAEGGFSLDGTVIDAGGLQIAGNLNMSVSMDAAKVTMEGSYTVSKKTAEGE